MVALGNPALVGETEDTLRSSAGQFDETLQAQLPLFTWVSMIGTVVCTPGMPEGLAG
jgi:hypothetical protein